MHIKKYIELAKKASCAERREEWQEAYQLWCSAQKEIPGNHINKTWAVCRALFCEHRMPKQKPNFTNVNPYYF